MNKRFVLCVGVIGVFFIAHGLLTPSIPKIHKPIRDALAPVLSPKQIETAKQFTVLLSMEGYGEVGRCTGIVISPRHVLTAGHCTEEAADTQMFAYTYPMHTVIRVKPVFVDRGHDLALLELEEPVKLKTYAKFAKHEVVGEPITSIGNVLGSMTWFVSHGIVADTWKFYVLSDVLIMGGNSGGPWLNLQGKVVGLSDFTISSSRASRGLCGAVGSDAILAFLRDYNNTLKLQKVLYQLFGGN